MSGYRANAGFGVLARVSPLNDMGEMPSRFVVYKTNGTSTNSCLHALNKRFGAGIELSINRNRNNNYLQDIGYREFTSATSGMYDIDFTISGAFVPEMSSWLEFLTMSEKIEITTGSTFTDKSGTQISNPSDTDQGYVKNGTIVSKTPILYADFKFYQEKCPLIASSMPTSTSAVVGKNYLYTGTNTASYEKGHVYECTSKSPLALKDVGSTFSDQAGIKYTIYQYANMDGPKYFDIGYQLINENTTFGSALNELGVLVGCVIDSVSINYESGSDAQVKFTINGYALNEYVYTTEDYVDYNVILEEPLPKQPLVAGCLSVLKGDSYVAIAQTDSAGITVSNNTTKLGNCQKLTYSSIALGSLGVEMNVSTYANDPNKFLTYMYGYSSMSNGTTYSITKQPYSISHLKIRSDNTSSVYTFPTQLLDLNVEDVFVGTANRTYNVDNAIMDEPDLRPRKIQIVVGCGYKS